MADLAAQHETIVKGLSDMFDFSQTSQHHLQKNSNKYRNNTERFLVVKLYNNQKC